MPSPILPFLALFLAFAGLGGQDAPDDPVAQTRLQLESQRRELLANIADPAWMGDSARASIVRLTIERNWTMCAANEGTALARASERPARLLAEAALTVCKPWEQAFVSALQKGADPYLDGRVSREDMVTGAQLQSRDAALARIMLWRGASTGPRAGPAAPLNVMRNGMNPAPSILSQPAFPKAAVPEPRPTAAPEPAGEANGPEIVVVAQRRNQCQVRLVDRTLTEAELTARAKQWAAAGTPLRIVRPRGADYGCLAKIAWHLNQYGVHLMQVVEP